MELQLRQVESVPVLALAGQLFRRDAASTLALVADTLASHSPGVLVCDVSRLEPPASEALLALFPAALRRAGGWPYRTLSLASPSALLAAALRRAGTARYVPVHATLEEAVRRVAAAALDGRRRVTLPPDPSSVPVARETAARLCTPPTGADVADVRLVVSELVTNTVRHVGEPFRLDVVSAPRRMLLAVTDPSRAEPVLRPARPSPVDGRGMHLVDRLSRDWGVRLVHAAGKTVWASLGDGAGGKTE